jgi:hypothetical protein
VIGIKGTMSADQKHITLEWNPVVLSEDKTPCDDLLGYNVLRCKDNMAGAFQVMGTTPTVKKDCTSWTDVQDISAGVYYYKVLAVDNSLNLSRDSFIIDTSKDENLIVLAGGDDFTRLLIPKSASGVLYGETNSYGEDLKVCMKTIKRSTYTVITDTYNVTGSTTAVIPADCVKGYEFTALNDMDERIKEFSFKVTRPQIVFTYSESDLVSALRAFGSRSYSEDDYVLSLYWHNGKEWIRESGDINKETKTVTIKSRRLGSYLIRLAETIENLQITSVTPRTLTPNGDHRNDVLNIIFDYPFDEENPQLVSAKIFDINGALVSEMFKGPVSGSEKTYSAKWDGKSSAGEVVESGIYIYQIEVGGEVLNGAIVVAK